MAYAAVDSLLGTRHRLLNCSRISLASSTPEILKSAYESVLSLRNALQKYDDVKNSSEGVMASDARIREELRKLEDAIESDALSQFLSRSESHGTLSLNLDHLRQDIDCFAQTAKKLADEYIQELYKPCPEEEEDADHADSDGNERNMVGSSDQFLMIRDALIGNTSEPSFVSISGMAGIGKTTLAKRIFHDSFSKENFECRAFVKVGQKYKPEEIFQAIIAQVNLDNEKMIMGEDEDLKKYFERSLRGRKYLIVLDDIWTDDFYVQSLQLLLPYQNNGSRILLLSREPQSAAYVAYPFHKYKMRFMNEEESWELLRRKVFGEEEECPPQLVKAGKKIAENCEGLPLLILTVAKLLSKVQKDLEYWEKVAEKQNSVFEEACDQISEVLISSYHYLPQYLQMRFLYMVVFPQKHIIQRSKIENIWWAEGFGNLDLSLAFHNLVSRNLVVVDQRNSSKSCRLHSAYWHLVKREAENNKVVHILNSYADGSGERVKGHRCLAIYKNALFAIKEVHNSIASISSVRSLLCTGPYHQYQVPICSEWRLLRILDALTIRFYEFPVEVVELILLRYLALTCNADLPSSISQLWNLQYLIVHQHVSIKRVAAVSSCVAEEIWDLQELKHLQIVGRNLPNPPPGKVLPNLKHLLDVGAQSCTMRVLESIPNLEKLQIQIELAPLASQTLSCFHHISCLRKLKSLKSVIVNPKLMLQPILPPLPFFWNSIYSLAKLSLSGFGYPWKDMSKVANLPNLEVIKLRCYAFRGEKWEAEGRKFSEVRYLIIEDTDLVQWTAQDGIFPQLSWLTMKNCHKLQEIPRFSSRLNIELVDCNPLAETWAKQRVDAKRFHANYSWK